MSDQFEDTGKPMVLLGQERPVLKLGARLYVGETLSLVNPHGFGGRVWSARTRDQLKYNAHFGRHDERDGH